MKEGIKLIGQTILGYTIEEEIGSGGFGTVYKASKSNRSGTYVRAIKHISLPTKKQYNDVLNSMGGDYSKADNYFSDILKDIVGEIQILNNLTEQGVRNVVWYYENQIDESQSPLRYDIYILMEYLTPFDEYIQKHEFTVRDAVKLGKDIAAALVACHKNNVIHRDIKDENIFVANDGTYKLGDFGVSKKLQDRSRAESMKGTPNYIAPEVYLGRGTYDNTVDIYSLGIVLYKLLNYNRNPFMPKYPEPFNSNDEDAAFENRMKELTPELPQNAENNLGNIILKAIGKRSERYNSAADFFDILTETEKSLTNEELNKVISTPAVNNKRQTSGTVNKDGGISLKETIGENYEVLSDTAKEKGNGNLFETRGEEYTPPVLPDEPKRIIPGEKEEPLKKETLKEERYKYDYTSKDPCAAPPEEPHIEPIQKGSFDWLLYAAPFVILSVYIVLFFVLLPKTYDNTVSFIDWAIKNPQDLLEAMKSSDNVLPPIYRVLFLKLLNIALFSGLIVSLYFIGRKLHFSKPNYASNATLTDKEAYYLSLEIYEELKAESIPDTSDVISSVKAVHDRLKNDSSFGIGNQSVIRCEQEIESLLRAIQSNIAGLKNENTFSGSKQTILTSCNRITAKMKLRTELKKR